MGRLMQLVSILNYDKSTGIFTYKSSGRIAGHKEKHGYVVLQRKGKRFKAHRIAWIMTYGMISKDMQIDHINQNRSDNRIENLRIVDAFDNHKNRTMNSNNSSGQTGVRWNKKDKRWHSTIHTCGKTIFIGGFCSYSDAVDARKNAEVLYGFHKNHGKRKDKK